MNHTTNLIARLRDNDSSRVYNERWDAAEAIERLEAANTRLREALDKAATRFEHCSEMINSSFAISGTLRSERAIKAHHYALEARAALSEPGL